MSHYTRLYVLMKYFRLFQISELDIQLGISGRRGCGKSTLCLDFLQIYINTYGRLCQDCKTEFFYGKRCPVCNRLNIRKLFFIPEYHIKKYFIYNNADLVKKIRTAIPFTPYVVDEGVRFMLATDWNKPESRNLVKLLSVCRTKHLFMMYNVLRFTKIFSTYRQDIITHRIWIVKKGRAVLFTPDLAENKDCWYLDEFNKITGVVKYTTPPDDLIRKVSRHKTFTDYFKFPDIDRKIYLLYKEIRDKAVYAEEEKKLNKYERAFYSVIYNLYHNWDKFLDGVVNSKGRTLRWRILHEHLLIDPVYHKFFMSQASLQGRIRGFMKKYKLADKK